ncbi:DEAD/DEAH box helicase family protein, partial [Priestia flexa]|uniref:DEAD/DEAH box helicase family protein n=1 Tax=Priestia flexa TaxID=86664 RepID=UPI002E24C4C2|nr:DEAD/DEAH box helicase family protein [Priestia flexa]
MKGRRIKLSKVTVIDSIMGSGKTSWAKEYMKRHQKSKRFIYVSPYLEEIHNNILIDCPFLVEPDSKLGKGSKLKHFKELLVNGVSIVTTHALFRLFDDEVIELLNGAGYILILDEVANVIEKLEKVTKQDIEILLNTNKIKVKDRNVIWLDDGYSGVFDGRYANIKYHAQQGNIYLHRDIMLFWTFPARIFDLFDEAYILTYLFDGQIQRYYYDLFEIDYTYKSVEKIGDAYCLVSHNPLSEGRTRFKNLIKVYEGKSNYNYVLNGKVKGNELSATWLKNASDEVIERIKKNLYTYFRSCGKSGDNLWTTKKSMKYRLQGKGYTKGFIPWTTRATNEYQDTHNLAFVYNLSCVLI